MRDLDLVQRAERAAAALEDAWIHWRVRHGLGTGPLSPVSSYVGYSLTEPWGQPRVVFGVDADEAERLAAIVAGHDCVEAVYAEVASRPELPQPPSVADPAPAQPAASQEPAQLPADTVVYLQEPAASSAAEAPLPPVFPAALVLPPAAGAASDADLAATCEVQPAAEIQQAVGALGHHGTPAADALPAADGMPPVAPPDVPAAQPAIVPLRPRSVPPPEQLEVSHEPVRRTAAPNVQPWRPGKAEEEQAGPAANGRPDPQGEDQLARARLTPVSKLSRTRRPSSEVPEAGPWQRQGAAKQKPSDTAV